MIPVEVFDATNKITFVIFDWDAKKIIKKSAINLFEKQNEVQIIEIIVKLLIIIYI